MSAYEEEVVERCLASVVERLRKGPMRWRDVRNHLIAIGSKVEPAYQGRLIDSFIWRRVADELQRRDLAEKQEWWALISRPPDPSVRSEEPSQIGLTDQPVAPELGGSQTPPSALTADVLDGEA